MENIKKNFWNKATIYLLAINFFFLQSYLIRFQIGPYPSNLQEILITINAALCLIVFISKGKTSEFLSKIKKHWIILSLILLTLISYLTVKPVDNLDFYRHIKFLFFGSVLGLTLLEGAGNNENIKKIIKIGGLGAIIFGIFSVVYNLIGYNVTHDLRLIGPMDAAVYLAYYLVPFFIFFSIEFLNNTKDKSSLINAIILGILILATRSMGAIGGSFIVMMIYILKQTNLTFFKSRSGKTILIATGVIILSAIFYTKILPTIQTNYSSLSERGEIWKTALYLLKDPKNLIFGVGFGQFQTHYFGAVVTVLGHQPLDFFVLQPHNIFLLFTLNYGLLGLVFITLLLFKTLQRINNLQKAQSSEIQTISLFILLYFFIHGLIDTPIFKNDLLSLFIIFAEIALIQQNKLKD